MREIEFRAWDQVKKKMVRCSIHQDGLAIQAGYNIMTAPTPARFMVPMQYTGLKDANGVKIFEGDIMQWHGDESTVAVKWEQATCSYTAFGRLCAMHLKPDEDGDGHLLVIGNIYETPERLHDQVSAE